MEVRRPEIPGWVPKLCPVHSRGIVGGEWPNVTKWMEEFDPAVYPTNPKAHRERSEWVTHYDCGCTLRLGTQWEKC